MALDDRPRQVRLELPRGYEEVRSVGEDVVGLEVYGGGGEKSGDIMCRWRGVRLGMEW